MEYPSTGRLKVHENRTEQPNSKGKRLVIEVKSLVSGKRARPGGLALYFIRKELKGEGIYAI